MSWNDINKTSIQSSALEFINNLEEWVLKPDEKLNEAPSSFNKLLASTLGKISAFSNFSMLMAKRELTPSTAILAKSLLRNLKSEDLASIYGTSSNTQIVVSYPIDDIIQRSVIQSDGKYKLTLNKNTVFLIGNNPPFTLDYDINIFTTKYNNEGKISYSTYAMYDTDDLEAGNILSVNNPYINSRNDVIINGKQMFSMYINIKQFNRKVDTFDMTGEPKDISVQYTDKLMGFVVLYKSQSSNTFTKVNCYLEGEIYTDGLCYTLGSTGNNNSIKFKFSKLPDAFNPTNGVIKIITYTTAGEDGNYTLGQIDKNTSQDMNVLFNQNVADASQYALLQIIPTCSIISNESTGGRNSLDLEGIRGLVIQSGNGEVITPATIKSVANKRGFSPFKKRHDLYALEYVLSSFLTNVENGYIIPSKTIDGYFSFDDIPVNTETNSRMITPSNAFIYDKESKMYKLLNDKTLSVYNVYYNEYKKDLTKEQYIFPYFIKIKNGDSLDVNVYDESIDETKSTQFTYVSDEIYDKASITNLMIYRNPISSNLIAEDSYEKDYYRLAFDVYVSDFIYEHLKSIKEKVSSDEEYVKFRVLLKNKSDGSIYARNISLDDCEFDKDSNNVIHCITNMHTNSSVLDDDKICIDNNTLNEIPYSKVQYGFYYVDNAIDIDVVVLFKSNIDGSVPQEYKQYLTAYEQNNKYYVGIIYSCSDIVLSRNMTEEINIVSDLKLTQPVYQTADSDIPDIYTENVYKTKDDGTYEISAVTTELPDGSMSSGNRYTPLHYAGDIKKELDGRVGTYNANSANSWKWSNEATETGIYDAGNVLGGVAIHAIVEWNNLVIFAGDDGRIGCYDIKYNKWHPYNEASSGTNKKNFRDPDVGDSSGYVIKGDTLLGSYMDPTDGVTKKCAIRGLKIIERTVNDIKYQILLAFGDMGRLVCCKLATNTWNKFDGSNQDNSGGVTVYYSNGRCINNGSNEYNALYTCQDYTVTTVSPNGTTSEKQYLLFAGGAGRICSLSLDEGYAGWRNFDSDIGTRSRENIFSDGSDRGYRAILSSAKYLENSIYLTGIDGVSSVVDLTTGEATLLNDGNVVDNKTMYSCEISGSNFIQAGRNGYVASYNIIKNQWNNYNAGGGLCSDGKYMDGADIFAVMAYGTTILFCGDNGRISNYETITNAWEPYNSQSGGITSEGDFIKNTISCCSYDSKNGNNVIYFGGKTGNITYKYRKNDIIMDSNGKPVIKEDSKQICLLNDIPAFSRAFAIPSNFFNVLKSYNQLIDKIAAMDDIFVDDGNLYLGLKTTSGESKYYYFQNNKTYEKQYLDSLAISLRLGVKFEDNITEKNTEFLIETIKTEIINYVKNIQTDNKSPEFNINAMLDNIKQNVPSILYFEYYGLNNYESTECQTIYKEDSLEENIDNEYLCIQNVIDEANSDLTNNDVKFVPNISIIVL